MLERLSENPWPVFGAIALASFVGYVAWRNNFKIRRAQASQSFRSVILCKLAGLYPIPTNWPTSIDSHLRQIFPELQRAVAEFRPYVPWHARRSFDAAWFVYRLGRDGREIDKQLYHQYMGFTSPGRPVIDPKETFRANVDKLLSFARET